MCALLWTPPAPLPSSRGSKGESREQRAYVVVLFAEHIGAVRTLTPRVVPAEPKQRVRQSRRLRSVGVGLRLEEGIGHALPKVRGRTHLGITRGLQRDLGVKWNQDFNVTGIVFRKII